jgi:enamine deaminase RidA (YjgF/YER057c/UK114 family)
MTPRRTISSGSPWEPRIGYSRAVIAGNVVYVSGTVGVGADGSIPDTPEGQTRRALEIIAAALAQAGAEMSQVVRTRLFLSDITHFDAVAKVHGEVFGDIRPATTMVAVARLVDPAFVVEIEAEAVI